MAHHRSFRIRTVIIITAVIAVLVFAVVERTKSVNRFNRVDKHIGQAIRQSLESNLNPATSYTESGGEITSIFFDKRVAYWFQSSNPKAPYFLVVEVESGVCMFGSPTVTISCHPGFSEGPDYAFLDAIAAEMESSIKAAFDDEVFIRRVDLETPPSR